MGTSVARGAGKGEPSNCIGRMQAVRPATCAYSQAVGILLRSLGIEAQFDTMSAVQEHVRHSVGESCVDYLLKLLNDQTFRGEERRACLAGFLAEFRQIGSRYSPSAGDRYRLRALIAIRRQSRSESCWYPAELQRWFGVLVLAFPPKVLFADINYCPTVLTAQSHFESIRAQ